MIDLRKIYQNELFQKTVIDFEKKIEKCAHTLFKPAFLEFSNYKCPMCENSINPNDDIDHHRPHSKYEFLKCCYKNYIMICDLCNRAKYKGSHFPIDGIKATNIDELENEKPLLINPCVDNIYKFFELEFTLDENNRYVINITPNSKLNEDSFEFQRAKKTIEIFGLDNCKNDDCKSENMKIHYCLFKPFAKSFKNYLEIIYIMRNKNIEEITDRELMDYEMFKNECKEYRKSKELQQLKTFGFYKFIVRGQFKINLP